MLPLKTLVKSQLPNCWGKINVKYPINFYTHGTVACIEYCIKIVNYFASDMGLQQRSPGSQTS